jgi:hypothetical protein
MSSFLVALREDLLDLLQDVSALVELGVGQVSHGRLRGGARRRAQTLGYGLARRVIEEREQVEDIRRKGALVRRAGLHRRRGSEPCLLLFVRVRPEVDNGVALGDLRIDLRLHLLLGVVQILPLHDLGLARLPDAPGGEHDAEVVEELRLVELVGSEGGGACLLAGEVRPVEDHLIEDCLAHRAYPRWTWRAYRSRT